MSRRAAFVVLVSCSSAAALAACREPTEITVELTTDVPCDHARGAAITVGQPGALEDRAPSATSAACATSGRIGSLVVVPSNGDSDDVGIKAVIGVDRDTAECKPPYGKGCIVARRALHFLPHTPLVVPIHLELSCEGIACDPNTTCVHGACVPALVPDPSVCESASGCDEGTLYPDAGRSDATIADASNDTTVDSPSDSASDTSDAPSDSALPDAPFDGTVAACGDMGGLATGAPWPMGDYCVTHIGRSPFVGPQSNHLAWSLPLREAYGFSIGADGTIYYVDGNVLTAVGPDGGAKWTSATSVSPQTPTLGSDGNIYVGGAYEPTIFVFSPDGGAAGRYATGFDAGSAQADFRASNGAIFVRLYDGASSQGNVFVGVYDVTSRQISRLAPVNDAGVYEPSVSSVGTIYSGGYDGVLRAAAATGGTSWVYDVHTTSAIIGAPMILGGRVVVSTYNGVQARDALDGGPAWVAAVASNGQVGTSASNGTIYVGAGTSLAAVNGTDGGIQWQTPLPGATFVESTPVVDGNGTIYIGASNGVHAVSPDGGIAWSYATPVAVPDHLAVGNGVLLFHTDFAADGGMTLYAIGP